MSNYQDELEKRILILKSAAEICKARELMGKPTTFEKALAIASQTLEDSELITLEFTPEEFRLLYIALYYGEKEVRATSNNSPEFLATFRSIFEKLNKINP